MTEACLRCHASPRSSPAKTYSRYRGSLKINVMANRRFVSLMLILGTVLLVYGPGNTGQ
jgi:hypothetical protein